MCLSASRLACIGIYLLAATWQHEPDMVHPLQGGISSMITKHVQAAAPPALLPDEEVNKAPPELTETQHSKLQAAHSLRVRLIAVAQVRSPFWDRLTTHVSLLQLRLYPLLTGAGDWHRHPLGAPLTLLLATRAPSPCTACSGLHTKCVLQVFIGIGMGVEPRLSVIQPLLIALIFHQARKYCPDVANASAQDGVPICQHNKQACNMCLLCMVQGFEGFALGACLLKVSAPWRHPVGWKVCEVGMLGSPLFEKV